MVDNFPILVLINKLKSRKERAGFDAGLYLASCA